MNEQLKELEEKISYHFQDKHLLVPMPMNTV